MKAKFRWGIMIGLPFVTAVVFAFLLYGEYYGEYFGSFDSSMIIPTETVTVSSNVSAQFQEASLHLAISEYAPFPGTKTFGTRSLGSPCGQGEMESGTNYSFQEERLTAITQDGFEVRFTRRQCPFGQTNNMHFHQIEKTIVQTNTVLFRFGETTETNTIGLRIVGKFK
jgi:hypothetical protein